VGGAVDASGFEAFVWTSGGGLVALGDLPGGNFDSYANDVSADGSTVVGKGASASGDEAFLWTSGGGMVGLGDLPGGGFYSEAHATSADGSIVVGETSLQALPYNGAFIWDATNGMRDLTLVLTDLGLDLTDWVLTSARGISDDGRVIAGRGINPNGDDEAWIAVLGDPAPAIPVPALSPVATAILASLLGAAGLRRRPSRS
jgi:probable HAF family extracellular repeat protein